jgi:hypothetical protein
MIEQIFDDANEPFWRSAKQMELTVIPPPLFANFLRDRFEGTSRPIDEAVIEAILATTHSHPYGTQELAYALWEVTPRKATADTRRLHEALGRVLCSENAHFTRIWERASKVQRVTLEALAHEPAQPPLASSYRLRHNLPAPSTVQRALGALVEDELIERSGNGYRIAERFLAEWIRRYDV